MNQIELFDKYINGELPESERRELEARLKSEPELAADYKVYLFTVHGLCREEEERNLEFGQAMKKLTKEQLREIIGPRRVSEKKEAPKKRMALKPWVWQTLSVAAVVVIAFTAVQQIEKQSRYDVDNTICVCNVDKMMLARSGGETMDLSGLSDDEIRQKLPQLKKNFETAVNDEDVADLGMALALSYLHLHERDHAREVLQQLIDRFEGNPNFEYTVAQCQSFLKLLK